MQGSSCVFLFILWMPFFTVILIEREKKWSMHLPVGYLRRHALINIYVDAVFFFCRKRSIEYCELLKHLTLLCLNLFDFIVIWVHNAHHKVQ